MTKHRSHIEILLWQRISGTVVFDKGTNCSCGSFGPESERSTVPVLECIHLFFDDVGRRPDASGEQGRDLENRDTNFLKAVTNCPLPGSLLDEPPTGSLFRKNVFNALNAFDHIQNQ